MDTDPYSLSRLRDIVVPDAPPFWPPAAGFWVAVGIVLLLAGFLAYQLYRYRQQTAYRKAGVLLLNDARTLHDICVTLKRVALAAFPREEVASLYGAEWSEFLHVTCPKARFDELVQADGAARANRKHVDLAGTWIMHHSVPGAQPESGRH